MLKISELESNANEYLNEDNHYGTFYLENLDEMARAGKVPNTVYEIHIESGEGYTPHFHLCKYNGKKENIVLRICLLKNEYFREKDDKNNILNSTERKALNQYLNSIYSQDFNITRWQHICTLWNDYNPAHQIKNINLLTMPNYTTILEP